MGSFAVGKTSLIRRFVNSIFTDKYHTTVGVKIDKKDIKIQDQPISFIIWDIAGKDTFADFRPAYLRGVSAYVIVIDGTRLNSIDVGIALHKKAQTLAGKVPVVFAVNKSDLTEKWQMNDETFLSLQQLGFPVIVTSAKTGESVEDIFIKLGEQIIPKETLGNALS